MAKTKKKGNRLDNQKLSLVVTAAFVSLCGVLMGAAVYYWQESAYDLGENEGQMEASARSLRNQTGENNAMVAQQEGKQIQNNNSKKALAQEQKNLRQADIESTFEEAINNRDELSMREVMANQVNYIEEATECCGKITKNAAVKNFLDYSKGTALFNFAETQQIVKQMRTNLPQSFSQEKYTKIGIGNDKKVVAYHLNAQNQVDGLYIAITHQLFDLE